MSDHYSAWVTARWLKDGDVSNVNPDKLTGVWREFYGVMVSTNGVTNRQSALDIYLKHRPGIDPNTILGWIMQVDPAEDYKEPSEDDAMYNVQPDVPALPSAAMLNDKAVKASETAGEWLNQYMAWAIDRADRSPEDFIEVSGLWVAGLCLARRLSLGLGHDTIYPNLYCLCIAPTTLYAKSIAQDCGAEVVQSAVPHLLLPRDLTPESMLDEMAGKTPVGFEELSAEDRSEWESGRLFAAQRGQYMDEASSLFTSFSKDYNAGLAEAYLLFYDSSRSYKRRTKSGGLVIVKHPCLSFLGSTTPMMFKEAAGSAKHWGSGLWVRFNFLTPSTAPHYTQPKIEQQPPPSGVVHHIKQLAETYLPTPEIGKPPKALSVKVERDVFKAYTAYDKAMFEVLAGKERPDERLFGTYGRQSTKALKIALVLAALDWDGAGVPTINIGHWARAQLIAEKWRGSVHRLLAWMSRDASDDEEQRVVKLIRGAGLEGVSVRDLSRRMGMNREQVEALINNLTRDGIVEPHQHKPGTGRPTVKYREKVMA